MTNSRFSELPVCAEYSKLLRECQDAFESLHARREEVARQHMTGIDVGRELLSLQAHFAKAYALLRQHTKTCRRCQLELPRGNRSASRGSGTLFFDGVSA